MCRVRVTRICRARSPSRSAPRVFTTPRSRRCTCWPRPVRGSRRIRCRWKASTEQALHRLERLSQTVLRLQAKMAHSTSGDRSQNRGYFHIPPFSPHQRRTVLAVRRIRQRIISNACAAAALPGCSWISSFRTAIALAFSVCKRYRRARLRYA